MNNVPPKPGGKFRFFNKIYTIRSIKYNDIIFAHANHLPDDYAECFSMEYYQRNTFTLPKHQFLRSKVI